MSAAAADASSNRIQGTIVSNPKYLTLLAAAIALAVPPFSRAQQQETHQHTPTSAQQPYAGQQERAIKALSAQEQQDWLEGKGIGLAKTAELNGYPGPQHVLEHASALALSPAQKEASHRLLTDHKNEVRALGRELVAAEQALDDAFRGQAARDDDVDRLTREIGVLQARIRAGHLRAHLAQTALLRPEQIARYQQLRGYSK
jgi:hypothetical protein